MLPTDAAAAGAVYIFKAATSSFDQYTSSPTPDEQQWMRDHYARMLTYYPYFDSRLSWFPNAWVYQDLYAIYRGSTLATDHPEWILRDAGGNALYIPYACAGGTCPQYAADVGDAAFRSWWIGEAKTRMAFGYKGIFVDDVNLRMQVSDGSGHAVAPWDDRLGRTMTVADWRRYMAEFTELIRAALPAAEIVHNQVWFFAPLTDPYVQRAIAAADVIEIERGFNDTGIRGGDGTWGFGTLMTYIDTLHFIGRGVVYGISASWGQEYGLAMYFLLQGPRDAIANDAVSRPDTWWSANDTDLGTPLNTRYRWNGVWRRDFTRGLVLANAPEEPTRTLTLPRTYRGVDGGLYSGVTLSAADGVVLKTP